MDVCLEGRANALSAHSFGPEPSARGRSVWVWAALGVLLVVYIGSALRVNPVSVFGTVGDDGMYFSSGQALASGQGYILPSFPVPLQATKYPELYALLLAGVWRLDPRFPGNVNLAAGITLAFGCAALIFVFLLLRRWPGMNDWQALAVTALCAFTGYFLDLSVSVMTDVPFMALLLGAIWMIENSSNRHGKRALWWAAGAGLLAGFTVGFRILGLLAMGGIGLALLGRRDFRRLFWFSLAAGPLAIVGAWPALAALFHPSSTQLAIGSGDSGWTQTLCYYRSYACGWHADVAGSGALRAVAGVNLKGILQEPGLSLLAPLAGASGLWGIIAVALASIASYAGIVRYTRRAGWRPLTVTFLLFLPVLLIWPYTPDRFLLSFLPLFFGGLWLEGRNFVALIARNLRPPHAPSERFVAALLALAGMAIAVTAAVNYAYATPSKVNNLANGNDVILRDERAAFAWIRSNAAPDSRLITYRDGLAYLYTGDPAVAPINASTQAFYRNDPRYAERDAARLADVARHIKASYWLVSADDFRLDGSVDYNILQKRERSLLRNAPLVFESADKQVRLYYVGCDFGAASGSCTQQEADRGGVDRETESVSAAQRAN